MITYQTATQAEKAWRSAQRKADAIKYQLDTLRQRESDLADEANRKDAEAWARATMPGKDAK